MRWPWVSRKAFTELEDQYVRLLVKTGKMVNRDAYDLAERGARLAHDEAVAAVERANAVQSEWDRWTDTAREISARLDAEEARYDKLLDKYHALRVAGANPPEPIAPVVAIPEPDMPPNAVLQAMLQISPVKDATYDANWKYWERNKELAAKYPDDFADEILEGATSTVFVPETKAVE